MPTKIPPQHQERQAGIEKEMNPKPIYDTDEPGLGRLKDKVAIVTGGDSGIGRAVAIQFAKEGANVVIAYFDEHQDAEETAAAVRKYQREAILIATDVSIEKNCKMIVDQTLKAFHQIDIVVNNAAVQYEQQSIEDISAEQLERTFKTNIFSHFYLTKFALPHLKEGSSIINTASVTAYKGNAALMDYASTKGAIIAFTRSLSQSLAKKKSGLMQLLPGLYGHH